MRMDPILVVGMNPSGRDVKGKKGPTISKLESWMEQLDVPYFSFINTFDEPGEAKITRVDFNRLHRLSKDYGKIIALRGFVSTVLNKIDVGHFKLPHPSPLNRLLNDREFEKQVIRECKLYLKAKHD